MNTAIDIEGTQSRKRHLNLHYETARLLVNSEYTIDILGSQNFSLKFLVILKVQGVYIPGTY